LISEAGKKVNIKRRYKTACLSRHLKVWPAEHCLALRIVAIYSLEIDHIKYHGENFRSYPCPNLVILFITTSIRAWCLLFWTHERYFFRLFFFLTTKVSLPFITAQPWLYTKTILIENNTLCTKYTIIYSYQLTLN